MCSKNRYGLIIYTGLQKQSKLINMLPLRVYNTCVLPPVRDWSQYWYSWLGPVGCVTHPASQQFSETHQQNSAGGVQNDSDSEFECLLNKVLDYNMSTNVLVTHKINNLML